MRRRRRHASAPPWSTNGENGAGILNAARATQPWYGGSAAARLLRTALLLFGVGGEVPSLTEADFEAQLRASRSALVAFVSPWCIACRGVITELSRLQNLLSQRPEGFLIAQCDVSRETGLSQRYRVHRTPVILLFPDTQVLAPGLQTSFMGQILHGPLANFVLGPERRAMHRIRTSEELRRLAKARWSGSPGLLTGILVGFFRSPDAGGTLQDLWSLDCARRHRRVLTFADGPKALRADEELWRWAGLDLGQSSAEEAIVFLPSSESVCEASRPVRFGGVPTAADKFSAAHLREDVVSWRSLVDSFCAWCERRALSPVTVLDPARAALLEDTAAWLLLLFAPPPIGANSTSAAAKGSGERLPHSQHFTEEKEQLERFMMEACDDDARYLDLSVVIVAWGEDDIAAFRGHFGVAQQDSWMQDADSSDPCQDSGGAHAIDMAEARSWQPGDGPCLSRSEMDAATSSACLHSRASMWHAALFDSRTRRKYRAPNGAAWRPGNEIALRAFTDAVFDGRASPYFRSAAAPQKVFGGAAPGIFEAVGSTLSQEALQPAATGEAEVLLLLYAPWCSHSLQFFLVWHDFARSVATSQDAEANHTMKVEQLRLVQMDATQNEHPDLPPVVRFPTLVLCAQGGQDLDNPAEYGTVPTRRSVHFTEYDGEASVIGLHAWLAERSAFSRFALPGRPSLFRARVCNV